MRINTAFLMLFAVPTVFSAITISNVRVDSLKDTAAAYGNIWRGIVTFDVASDSDSVYTWLEFSSDNGATWRIDNIHATGYVGTIPKGAGLKARWMVDGDKGPVCKIRVRVNDQPRWYVRKIVTLFDTVAETDSECPKPIPTADPYETIERMVNNKWQGMILPLASYKLPFYNDYSGNQPLNVGFDTATGNDFAVGMGKAGRAYCAVYPQGDTTLYYRATYMRINGREFVFVCRNGIRLATDSFAIARKMVQDSMGIPAGHILIGWDHTHYTDNGEPGADSTLAAIRRAKAAAIPAEMAWTRVSLGAGYNVRRTVSSTAGITDGPIEDNLWGVFFRGTDNTPIGSWVRFSGHIVGRTARDVSRAMSAAFGGECAYIQAGGGTSNVWDSAVSVNNPGAAGPGLFRPGTYTPEFVRTTLMNKVPALRFSRPDRIGTAWAVDRLSAIGPMQVTAWMIGGLVIPVFTAESPAEQLLYAWARLHNSDSVMTIGYSNGGGGNYYKWGHDWASETNPEQWPNHSDKDSAMRNVESTVRCVNILRNLFGI